MTIGQRIRARREELGLTQRGLAERLGYKDHTTLARIEIGTVDLTQSKIKMFSEALGVSTAWLMGWEDSPEAAGELAAEVLLNPEVAELVPGFLRLDKSARAAVLQLVKNLDKKRPNAAALGKDPMKIVF